MSSTAGSDWRTRGEADHERREHVHLWPGLAHGRSAATIATWSWKSREATISPSATRTIWTLETTNDRPVGIASPRSSHSAMTTWRSVVSCSTSAVEHHAHRRLSGAGEVLRRRCQPAAARTRRGLSVAAIGRCLPAEPPAAATGRAASPPRHTARRAGQRRCARLRACARWGRTPRGEGEREDPDEPRPTERSRGCGPTPRRRRRSTRRRIGW